MRKPAVGLSYAGYIPRLIEDVPYLIDYIEVPIEILFREVSVLQKVLARRPVVLHCASLSLAGDVGPSPLVVEKLKKWIGLSRTPWLGEHLAYVRTDGKWQHLAEHEAVVTDSRSPGEVPALALEVGYTVSPQFSPAVLERVVENTSKFEEILGLPILLENGPIYFEMPGSTMSQVDFIQRLCNVRPQQRILLDLVHLEITCKNLGLNAKEMLSWIPADRVDEVHLSGYLDDGELHWDDHASSARDSTFALLSILLSKCRPRAITLEYNWDSQFAIDTVKTDVRRVKDLL